MIKTTVFLGQFMTKCGIDANVIIDLVLYQSSREYFKKKGYSFPDKFLCTLPQVIGEIKGVLINKYDFKEEDADARINKVLKDFCIEKIKSFPINDDIHIVEEIGEKYGLNDEDIPIIYSFWKYHVKMVLVRDKAFQKTCEELNINVIEWQNF